ncbi:MAG: hypothetical protein ACEPO8_10325 [Rhodothermaceae bacterium]
MKKNKLLASIIMISSVFLVFALFSWIYKANKSDHNKYSKIMLNKIERVKRTIVGKQVLSFKNIIREDNIENKILVFHITGNDCSTCVDKITKLFKEVEFDKKFFITRNINIGYFQIKNEINNYLYEDSKDSIRIELKFSPTPAVYLLDNFNILDVYYPQSFDDKDERERFRRSFIDTILDK